MTRLRLDRKHWPPGGEAMSDTAPVVPTSAASVLDGVSVMCQGMELRYHVTCWRDVDGVRKYAFRECENSQPNGVAVATLECLKEILS